MTILPSSSCRQNLVEALVDLLDGDEALSLNVASDWLNIPRTSLILDSEVFLTPREVDFVQDRLLQLKEGFPLAYVEGKVSFMGFDFICDPRVLIPRMDSESVVELALSSLDSSIHSPRVLDMCTGSGCLLLSVLKLLPAAEGVGTDCSIEALECAKQNLKKLELEDRARFFEEDIFYPHLQLPLFDLIICNPPYILLGEELGVGVREYEPNKALFVTDGDPMQFYRAAFSCALQRLNVNGKVVFEIGASRFDEVLSLSETLPFKFLSVRKDLGDNNRAVSFEVEN